LIDILLTFAITNRLNEFGGRTSCKTLNGSDDYIRQSWPEKRLLAGP